jgi:hypothetical protein
MFRTRRARCVAARRHVTAAFRGPPTSPRRAVLALSPLSGGPSGAVREGDWKLIEFYEYEENRVKRYRWRRSVNAQMPGPNPNYDPAKADQGLSGAEPPTEPV